MSGETSTSSRLVPHIVRRGESLARIARTYGVDGWRTIYEHDRNEDFRNRRPDPNRIQPGDQVWVPVTEANAWPDVGSGRRHRVRIRRIHMALESLEFRNSYEMHDNYLHPDGACPYLPGKANLPEWARADWSWSTSGTPFATPEWGGGRSAPVCLQRGTRIEATAVVELKMSANKPIKGRLLAHETTEDRRDLYLRSERVTLDSGTHSVVMKAKSRLPAWPEQIDDRQLKWTFKTSKGDIQLGTTGPHTVFTVFNSPLRDDQPEDGATYARLLRSTRIVSSIGKTDPVDLIDQIFASFPSYVLGFRYLPDSEIQHIETVEHLKPYMLNVDWPRFMHKKDEPRLAAQGGAWPLGTLERYGGECQAIVRYIRGILMQLGHSGKVEPMYVNASAHDPHTAIIRDYGTACGGPSDQHSYSLVDRPVEVGKAYDVDGDEVGWNNYEAFLRYAYERDGTTYHAWYGGGIGLVGETPVEQSSSDTKAKQARLDFEQNLLHVFYGLAESKIVRRGTKKYRKVTRYWKYRDDI